MQAWVGFGLGVIIGASLGVLIPGLIAMMAEKRKAKASVKERLEAATAPYKLEPRRREECR